MGPPTESVRSGPPKLESGREQRPGTSADPMSELPLNVPLVGSILSQHQSNENLLATLTSVLNWDCVQQLGNDQRVSY